MQVVADEALNGPMSIGTYSAHIHGREKCFIWMRFDRAMFAIPYG
jgi:hypothetical protein